MRLRKRRFFCGKVEKGEQMEERKTLIPVKELAKRYALFIISLFISALGVAITKKGEFGVSPISSVAEKRSLRRFPIRFTRSSAR
mgnify:CR=1 FL=1